MVRLSCFLSLALAAQGLHAAPTVSRDQGDLQTRDISASEQITDILQRATERPGGQTAAEGQADRIAKAPAPNNGGFPTQEQEERTQLTNAQRKGFRGSTKFKDTPEGAAAADKSKNTPTERPGGKTAAEGQADRIAKGDRQ
ncbi:hypothetical protein J3459_011870 [Metarhizium acridum]|uniref:Uncharacterized protein n=1 Tax=Metarhizium acridum (strain CQMa 102) TaxID=655827 RepID=E9EG69_METAQ|nr:uncharacterized protein MAC_08867 [Metarhizium acridum CQMa 102]EFY85107.1 hypothetical protein MAC_08867 [Metarhizium acridum CQMa 102]KAG8418951.1 hypothetical protein J3459_011870 [Metarhizium acridum]